MYIENTYLYVNNLCCFRIDALKKQDAEDAIQEQAQTDIADDTANIQVSS